ncbi:MAG: hypothetical protein ACXVNF_00690 [Neobacillus sp.]
MSFKYVSLTIRVMPKAGTPYWSKSTVETFCNQEKNRLKKD